MSAATKLKAEAQERPMLFSGAMVRAILSGAKTQTRRLVAGQASTAGREHFPMAGLHWENDADVLADWREFLRCPHGAPGDRLWVRETWGYRGSVWDSARPKERCFLIDYQADGARRSFAFPADTKPHALPKPPDPAAEWGSHEAYQDALTAYWRQWRPSIFLPRWACRLELEVTDVRVERLQEISEEDARAEGVEAHDDDGATYYGPFNKGHASAKVAFSWLWESINGPESWSANPWTWVLSFRRLP